MSVSTTLTMITTETLPSLLPLPTNLNRLLKCVAKLIEKLPNQDIKEEVLEFKLCLRYIDPVLSGLFDDPDRGTLFRWTSVTNEESKYRYITKQRPNSVISQLDGLFYGPSLGFVEVKSAKKGSDKFAVSNDLVRLGLLSKNSIDRSNDPIIKRSNSRFVGYFDELLAVLDLFEEHCLMSACVNDQDSCKRKALPDEAFDVILSRMMKTKILSLKAATASMLPAKDP
ncbi:hypothetical protein BDB00DRAFT_790261 [Zychaea mexicana]|uniref:uncharacterized protein n=1 Tax=Zychaea mexicana TaxID=64656 RepID=UPI0022FE02D0|nr:uncharacterized protein BDB00DRAFT_790261 [Zychaea mexicana]KAI9490496.1 hypothetical protein BDB00DRAFT_790261 [Zychaea mexicana]